MRDTGAIFEMLGSFLELLGKVFDTVVFDSKNIENLQNNIWAGFLLIEYRISVKPRRAPE